MHSHEVMKEVLKKTSAKQIAADMGLSLSLIYKWAEPAEEDSGSGASSPLDRVGHLIRITKDPRIAQWVCEQAGGFYIRNPQQFPPNQPLIPITNDIVQEFADMLATIATSSADNVITKDEAKNIRRRWEELKTVTEGFVLAAEKGNYSALPPAATPEPKPAEKRPDARASSH
ncbi:MAG TPA: phage regulatory CII family protein [Opitutaceae bacterium]|nr:phage regulatory CII family protein [Opitutaceae bacterium]